MSKSPDRIITLIKAYLNGNIAPEQMEELEDWMNKTSMNRVLVEEFLDERKLRDGIAATYIVHHKVWKELEERLSFSSGSMFTVRKRAIAVFAWRKYWIAAASIIILSGLGFYFYTISNQKQSVVAVNTPKDISAPTSNRAMITLADGSRLFLDSVSNGQLAQMGNVKLVKLANGQIAYQTEDGQVFKELQYNTLTNPRGSKVIDMQLSDGSHVWLNAGSSITYPVAFVGNERNVELKGEGYFEVAKDPAKKFIVEANGVTTEVLGTHFNVNAYTNDIAIKITLLEGAVKVSSGNKGGVLRPGQQAIVASSSAGRDYQLISNPDIEQVLAWKNGIFYLNNLSIAELMEQIANWYAVEVVYSSNIPNIELYGKMGRDLRLSQVLKGLQKVGLRCRLDGHKIIVE
ncbi:MAG TPA: FecR domain-containing protein [Niabella sp.]|nr:FecR domain-containing protein [Niabella sp.]